MQELIKLKLTNLGYNRKGYNLMGKMDWLNKKNDIVFITIPKLIKPKIFTQFNYKFVIPALINYEDYLKVEKKYGGLPIALEEYETSYFGWLKSIDFFNFADKHTIKILFQDCWYIYPHNYVSVERINFRLKRKLIEKSIKTKKLKI